MSNEMQTIVIIKKVNNFAVLTCIVGQVYF